LWCPVNLSFLLFAKAEKVSKTSFSPFQAARKKWPFLCFKVKSGRLGSETQALLTKHDETAIFLTSLPGIGVFRNEYLGKEKIFGYESLNICNSC